MLRMRSFLCAALGALPLAPASETLAPGQLQGSAPEPHPFQRHGGHVYRLTSRPASWDAAEHEARTLGGHLVTIDDAAENAWLVRTFAPRYGQRNAEVLWIGLTDRGSEGTWTWISGAPVAYTNWGGIEPNNFADEDYAVLQTRHTGNACCSGPGAWVDIWSNGHGSVGAWPGGLLPGDSGQYGIVEIDRPRIAP